MTVFLSLAALALAQTPKPAALSLAEKTGIRLVYQTSLTYTALVPPEVEASLPPERKARHQISFTSTTFVDHLRKEGDVLVSDVHTWSEKGSASGWLLDPENQPKGPMKGGGLMKRGPKNQPLLVPKTTDFAPEIPVPVFVNQAVEPGSAWKASILWEGKVQNITHRFIAWEDRGGTRAARIEASGLEFSGLPLSAPLAVWIDPATGRTLRMEALFTKTVGEATASISLVRTLVREEPLVTKGRSGRPK